MIDCIRLLKRPCHLAGDRVETDPRPFPPSFMHEVSIEIGASVEVLKHPFRVEPVRRGDDARCGGIAAPLPLARIGDEPAANGVQNDVAKKLDKMRRPLWRNALEAPLHQMADPAVAPVEPLCIPLVEAFHAGRERRIGCLGEQVIMVRHQDVRVEPPAVLNDNIREKGHELVAIIIVAIDLAAVVTAADEMPDRTGIVQSASSRHSGIEERKSGQVGRRG